MGRFLLSERCFWRMSVESTRFETVKAAVNWAGARGLRQRAVCYVTRETDVLVLRHEPQPGDSWVQPGVQLPAGGVDPGETPAQAAVREAFEETGLANLGEPAYLGSCHWGGAGWTGPGQVWHYFQLTAPASTPDAWDHRVTGGEDTDMLFHLRFAPLSHHELTTGQGSHEYLDELFELLQLSMPDTAIQGDFLSLEQATAQANQDNLRQRAVVYITRHPDELLVFEHAAEDAPAIVQLPAGGIDPGETPQGAAVREAYEETGLSLSGPVHFASWHWTLGGISQVWHCIHFQAPVDTPDTWFHRVTSGTDDAGLLFYLRFAPLTSPGLRSGISQAEEAVLPRLQVLLASTSQELAHD